MSEVTPGVRLSYRSEWTAAAVEAVLEALPWVADQRTTLTTPRLRQLVKDQVGLLALMHWLAEAGLPYRLGASPLARIGREPVWVGGRRLFFFSTLIARREVLRPLRRQPGPLLAQAGWATIPAERLRAPGDQPEDALVFGYVLALVTDTLAEARRAHARGHPVRLVFPWKAEKGRWAAPQALALKYEGPGALRLTLHGHTETAYAAASFDLPEGERRITPQRWRTVYALSIEQIPTGRVGIAPPGGRPVVVTPSQWGNLWLYGLEVWLLGYLSRRTFMQQARYLPAGAVKAPGLLTRRPAYGVPLASLRSPEDLIARLVSGIP